MKRTRDDEEVLQASLRMAQLEIIYGLCKQRAAVFEGSIIEEHRRIVTRGGVDAAVLLGNGALPHYQRQLLSMLVSPANKSEAILQPFVVDAVQLLANDGRTVVLASSTEAEQGATANSLSMVDLPPQVGCIVFPGDVVVIRPATSAQPPPFSEDRGSVSSPHMAFLSYNAFVFTDAESWADAVGVNVVAVMQWTAQLLKKTPGLAQLSFIQSSSLGYGKDDGGLSGWHRSLQLPLLLRVEKELMASLDTRTVEQVRRSIMSILRIFVDIFTHTSSMIGLPRLHCRLLMEFIGSPLFVDGYSVIMMQLAGSVASAAWQSITQSFADGVQLGLRHVSYDKYLATVPNQTDQQLREAAEGAFSLVLFRISGAWLEHVRRAGAQHVAEGEAACASSSITDRVLKTLEERSIDGAFHHVTQWLQDEEMRNGTRPRVDDTSGVTALLDRAHLPPSTTHIQDLHGLVSGTVEEQVGVMQRTYTPYLSRDAVRFVEAAILVEYAELYGPASRAAHQMMNVLAAAEQQSDSKIDEMVAATRVSFIRISHVKQPGLRPGGVTSYTLEELSHIVEFGFPLSLHFQSCEEQYADQLQKDLHLTGTIGEGTGSLFGYVMIQLQGRIFSFPSIIQQADAKRATAYILKDADMLPEFIATSMAASDSGKPDAWLVWGAIPSAFGDMTSSNARRHLAEVPCLLPEGTAALSRVHIIRKLLTVRSHLQRRLAEGSRVGMIGGSAGSGAGGSLWMEYFATGAPPLQDCSSSLHPSAAAVLSGTTSTNGDLQGLHGIINSMTDATPFTPAQVEVLHALCSGASAQQGSPSATPALLSGLKVVEGVVGSGKTVMLWAAAHAKGQLQGIARKKQQGSLQPSLKLNSDALRAAVVPVETAATLEDLFGGATGAKSELIDYPDHLASAAIAQTREYVCLNEGLKYCSSPLLLRPGAVRPQPPPHVAQLLFSHADDGAREGVSLPSMTSVGEVIRKCHQRTLQAPLTAVLSHVLEHLRGFGNMHADLVGEVDGGDGAALLTGLLPLIMSHRDVRETMAASESKGKSSWASFLKEELWTEEGVRTTTNVDESEHWPVRVPHVTSFLPVEMPESIHLTSMTREQVSGWHRVYLERQADLLHRLPDLALDIAWHLFRCFYDVMHGVAAASQVTRTFFVHTTGHELLQQHLLPFLWTWNPPNLMIDNFDDLQDGLFLALPPANTVTVALSAETPVWMERHRRVPMEILRGLRKELHRTAALTTATLGDPQRCQRAELHQALAQLCLGSGATGEFVASLRQTTNDSDSTRKASAANGVDTGMQSGGDTGAPVFRGLVSLSGVEMWTHACQVSAGRLADCTAASFLHQYLLQFDASVKNCVYMIPPEDASATQAFPIRWVPFVGRMQYQDDEEECDTAIICLSGIAELLPLTTRGERSSSENRKRLWKGLQEEGDGLFTHMLQYWLWRILSRVRRGALIIGSKELFLQIGLLQRLSGFVLHQRELLNTQPTTEYWLPAEVEGAALPLNCPDHYRCKRVAILVYNEDGNTCGVTLRGTTECCSACLKPYSGCENVAHACLHDCHLVVSVSDSENVPPSAIHDHCPFPCCKTLQCGHMCTRACGESCDPCAYVGLNELACGQRVISGINTEKVIQYETFPHFQEVACCTGPLRCHLSVWLPCTRCGTKSALPCHIYLKRQSSMTAVDEQAVDQGGGSDGVVLLSETECPGCVGLYNKVAAKYGAETLPLPPIEKSYEDEPNNMPSSEVAGSLPRHLLSTDAQVELQREFVVAQKRAELLIKMEALSISSGNAGEKCDFSQFKAAYEAQKDKQVVQEKAWRDKVSTEVGAWERTLRVACERQAALNAQMESALPLMVSEALEEAERQRQFLQ